MQKRYTIFECFCQETIKANECHMQYSWWLCSALSRMESSQYASRLKRTGPAGGAHRLAGCRIQADFVLASRRDNRSETAKACNGQFTECQSSSNSLERKNDNMVVTTCLRRSTISQNRVCVGIYLHYLESIIESRHRSARSSDFFYF